MKQRNTKLALAVLAALSCLTTSAYAIENEFHGTLRIKGDMTNFAGSGGNDASGGAVLSTNNLGKSYFYTEQRLRLNYTAKLDYDVKVVAGFEVDSRWGDTDKSSDRGRNYGGAWETDNVNIETKNVYVEFPLFSLPTKAKVGLMALDDSYKGIFYNADTAAVMTETTLGKTKLTVGWMRAYDNTTFNGSDATVPAVNITTTNATYGTTKNEGSMAGMPGKWSMDIGVLDAKYEVNENLTLGGSYYLVYENLLEKQGYGYNIMHTLGVNAVAQLGPAKVDAFLLYQTGDNPVNNFGKTGESVSAFAFQVAGNVKIGANSSARASFLYASGDDGKGKGVNAFQGINSLGGETTSTFTAARMMMLIDHVRNATTTDRALIANISNNNMGVIGAFLGYDISFGKAFANANLGMAAIAKSNDNRPMNLKTMSYNNGNYVGTELNAEVGYKLGENMVISLLGGYVMLGDYYKDTVRIGGITSTSGINSSTTLFPIGTPDNPWKTEIALNIKW
ncbi:MAG: hypothetical protein WCL71_01915 [Deltaproteobacteria bacterium]